MTFRLLIECIPNLPVYCIMKLPIHKISIPKPRLPEEQRQNIQQMLHTVVIVFAALLAAYICVESLRDIEFWKDMAYMSFQFVVCVCFVIIFFVEMWAADSRWRFFRNNLFFLLVAIPYLNIVEFLHLKLLPDVIYLLGFMPLIRGGYAMYLVTRYVSSSRIIGMFWSYAIIMVLVMFFSAVLFFTRERGVNPDVHNFWSALWWASLELTTIGASINPVTPTGKVLAGILASMGMIMFPLFTVYMTDLVRRSFRRTKSQDSSQ